MWMDFLTNLLAQFMNLIDKVLYKLSGSPIGRHEKNSLGDEFTVDNQRDDPRLK